MTSDRLPRAARAGVTVVLVLLVVAVLAGTAAIRYGATTLQVSRDVEVSSAATARTWFGLELENPSAVPVVLRSLRVVEASNVRVVAARVLDHTTSGGGIGAVSPPLPASLQAAVSASAAVDGFVVPAHSRNRYQLIVLLERIAPGRAAAIRRTDVVYSALGLDHGAESDAVLCIRAPGAEDCPAA